MKTTFFKQFIQKQIMIFLTKKKLDKFDNIILPRLKVLINIKNTTGMDSVGMVILVHCESMSGKLPG